MNGDWLTTAAVIVAGICGLALLVGGSGRIAIALFALEYLAAFWLINQNWPVGLAAVKLISGWMAGALLGTTLAEEDETSFPSGGMPGIWFRLFAGVLVVALAFSVAPAVSDALPVPPLHMLGGLLLVGLGLLQLGMTRRTLHVILGLLSVLAGFDVIYSALESSVLLAGLGAMVTLGLAMVGAYLLAKPAEEGPR